jgi:hypothetical protein
MVGYDTLHLLYRLLDAHSLYFRVNAHPPLAPHYSPTDAKRLLAGQKFSGALTLLTFNIPIYQVAAEAIQAELGQVIE